MKTKRRFLTLLLALCISLMPLAVFAAPVTITSINTVDDFKSFCESVNGGYDYSGQTVTLNADLDLSGETNWTPIGTSSQPFSGIFDGQNHVIYNMKISTSKRYCGLFGYLRNASIRNLGIENAAVTSSGNDVAILSGFAQGGTIERCYVTGTVHGYAAVSGLLGSTYNGLTTVRNCYVRADLNPSGGRGDTAGISGWNESDSINIINSYSACIGELRPIAGWSDGAEVPNDKITNTYFDITLSPDFSSSSGRTDLGRTSEQLKTQSNYTDWDFNSVWAIDPAVNGGYPYLRGFTPGLGGAPGSVSVTVKDNEGIPVINASVSIKDASGNEIILNHQGSGVYSGTVTSSDQTFEVIVNGNNVGTVTQTGNGAATNEFTVTSGMTHQEHSVCGTACSHNPAHSSIEWEAWDQTDSLPINAGNYYLTNDVALSRTWIVSEDISLCLNGHKITAPVAYPYQAIKVNSGSEMNLCDCNGSESSHTITDPVAERQTVINGGLITGFKESYAASYACVAVNGTLNMYGGTIAGNLHEGTNSGFSGVYLSGSGKFNMYGGAISHNKSGSSGAAIGMNSLSVSACFTMYGGEISGNYGYRDIVSVFSGNSFIMAGGKIINNTSVLYPAVTMAANETDAIKLYGAPVISENSGGNLLIRTDSTVIIGESGLMDGAKIGVETSNTPTDTNPVPITGGNNADYSIYFTSDNESYVIENTSGNVIQLAVMHVHNWNKDAWNGDADNHWHECQNPNCNITENSGKNGYAAHTYDKMIATDAYKASEGDCDNPASYYKSCICGASSKGTVNESTFKSGPVVHKYGAYYNHPEYNLCHAQTCEGCGDVKFGNHDTPLSCGEQYCSICKLTWNAPHNWDFSKSIPNNDATCYSQGTQTVPCSYCTETMKIGNPDDPQKDGHSFINYVPDNNATCTENGTETAKCRWYDGNMCTATDTREIEDTALKHNYGDWISNNNGTHTRTCSNDENHTETDNCFGGTATYFNKKVCEECGGQYDSLLTDTTEPTGEISVGENKWHSFLNTITFGLFFKDTQNVSITASDDSYSHAGYTDDKAVKIEYYLHNGDTELTYDELNDKTFAEYSGSFNIDPDNRYVIYVKLTDHAGNVNYISSDGIVLDNTAPEVNGIEDGKTYCISAEFTVDEMNVDTVKDGEYILTSDNGEYELGAGQHSITVTDKSGNSVTVNITVNAEHTPQADDSDCSTEVLCLICNNITTAAKTHNFTGEWHTDETGHWHTCQNDGCSVMETKTAHSGTDDGDCKTAVRCECGWTVKEAQKEHELTYTSNNNGRHTVSCTNEGCLYSVQEDCSGGKATCLDKAECGLCGQKYGKLNPDNHTNIVKTESTEATHLTEGNIAYWYCDGCEKYFSDENGKTEITLADTVVVKLPGHTADENSWDSDESCHWNTCECGEEFNRESHDFEWITDKAATETEKGSQHEECKVCGYKLPAVEIPAAGTATEPGKTDNPQTRDSGSILLWLALAFVSCGAVYTLTVKSKKQKG